MVKVRVRIFLHRYRLRYRLYDGIVLYSPLTNKRLGNGAIPPFLCRR